MKRIFVQIASYRDTELPWTIRDLFEKAAHPDRITVGLCLQNEPETDQACELPEVRLDQVRCVRYRARESRGACWARCEVQKLWAGEEFTLQVDSHMRFEPRWDEQLLAMLKACPSPRAVLSTYPPEYIPPDILCFGYYTLMMPARFDAWGTLNLSSMPVPMSEAASEPTPGALCGGCFLFGPAQIIAEVPYDPYLYFLGEEISLSARLWTHGWEIYHPNKTVLYHSWAREHRGTHWDDVPTRAASADERSRRRVNHLLGVERTSKEEFLVELDRYGLGAARSLAQYEELIGVDFKARVVRRKRPITEGGRRRMW